MSRALACLAAWALAGCGAGVIDHSPPGNLLDPDTAGFEASVGQWSAWYSTSIARTTGSAQAGTASLEVTLTSPYGWGVALDNWPGFAATPGTYDAELWSRTSSTAALNDSLVISWRDESGNDLHVDTLDTASLASTWQHAQTTSTAPPGTTRLWLELVGSSEGSGDRIDVDEVFVGPAASR